MKDEIFNYVPIGSIWPEKFLASVGGLTKINSDGTVQVPSFDPSKYITDVDSYKNNATIDITLYGQNDEPLNTKPDGAPKNSLATTWAYEPPTRVLMNNTPASGLKTTGTETGRLTSKDLLTPGWSYKILKSDPAFQNLPKINWADTKLKRGKKLRGVSKKLLGWPNRNELTTAIDVLGRFQERVAALDKLNPENRMHVLARMLCDMPGLSPMLVKMGVCDQRQLGLITNLASKIAIKRKNRLQSPTGDFTDLLDEAIDQKISKIITPILTSKPYSDTQNWTVNIDIVGNSDPFVTIDFDSRSIDVDLKPSWWKNVYLQGVVTNGDGWLVLDINYESQCFAMLDPDGFVIRQISLKPAETKKPMVRKFNFDD